MHASSSIPANAAYLEQMAKDCPEKLAQQKPDGPEIIGAVYIHPSAHVDPTAKVSKPKQRAYLYGHTRTNVSGIDNLKDWSKRVDRPTCHHR